MTNNRIAALFNTLMALSMLMISHCLFGQAVKEQPLRATLAGFADRWANYGSIGDFPGFRDFLAVLHQPTPGGTPHDVFIKLRFLYWGEGKSDPKSLSVGVQQERVFDAMRDTACDESFASLSHEGDVSYHDPQLKPSRFVRIQGPLKKLPQPQVSLACYVVK